MAIFVKIIGGMGNQMFQYAAAKALSLRSSLPLYLDNESLLRHGERAYALDLFPIEDSIVKAKDWSLLGLGLLSYPLVRLKKHPSYYAEKDFSFNAQVLNLKAPVFLDGYFQSEKYFHDFEKEIRNLFQFKASLSDFELQIIDQINQCTAVSLHVRRGDYVSNPNANALLGTLSLDYYERAIALIAERFFNIKLFLFSDDPEWVKANLKTKLPFVIVDQNTKENSFRDMRLMSLCHHQIIANSSFSWWGAWLNPSKNNFVIAPEKWFQRPMKDFDLVPARWHRI